MIIKKEKIKLALTELLSLVVSVLFLTGIRIWFPVCEVTGENIMACHWAGEMLKAVSILLLVLTLLHIIIPKEEIKAGIDISLISLFVLTMNIPGNIIRLCGHAEMACQRSARPFTLVVCIVMIVLSLLDLLIYLSLRSNEKHKRNGALDR